MSVTTKIALIVFMAVIVFLVAIVVAIAIVFDKHHKFVIAHSTALAKVKELNRKYVFATVNNWYEKHTYDNANYYDTISCKDYLTYILQFKMRDAIQSIKDANRNKSMYNQYVRELNDCQTGYFDMDTRHYFRIMLSRYEKRQIALQTYHPNTAFSIEIKLFLSKINGEVYARKKESFGEKEIMSIIYGLRDKNGKFYRNRDIWDSICRVERGKVSNKMRFSIMKRDGNRCRYCGSTHNLEIDHIYPIAKGGKTTYDNLQTLCHRCNVNKGDSV